MGYIRHYFWVGIKLLSILYFFVFKAHRKSLTVFLYHEISDTPSPFAEKYDLNVSPATFHKQVRWISENFNVIHPQDILDKKKLPPFAALITFDDGFADAFNQGISYLTAQKIPSLMFLNMRSILTGEPMLSAIACFFAEKSTEFQAFADREALKKPYHLTLTPYSYALFKEEGGNTDLAEITAYQGAIADKPLIDAFDNSQYIVYGNHLFEHWNSTALTNDEFVGQYTTNREALKTVKNTINMFAFPNGQSYSCFTKQHVELLSNLKSDKIFYSSGGINKDGGDFLLNRTALTEHDNTKREFWFKIFRSLYFKKNRPFKKDQ